METEQMKPLKVRSKHGTYTAEYVLALAKAEGWKSSSDWRKSSMSSYVTACKKNWLADVYSALGWKMRQRKKKDTVEGTTGDVSIDDVKEGVDLSDETPGTDG